MREELQCSVPERARRQHSITFDATKTFPTKTSREITYPAAASSSPRYAAHSPLQSKLGSYLFSSKEEEKSSWLLLALFPCLPLSNAMPRCKGNLDLVCFLETQTSMHSPGFAFSLFIPILRVNLVSSLLAPFTSHFHTLSCFSTPFLNPDSISNTPHFGDPDFSCAVKFELRNCFPSTTF